jgi:hypothetical protein
MLWLTWPEIHFLSCTKLPSHNRQGLVPCLNTNLLGLAAPTEAGYRQLGTEGQRPPPTWKMQVGSHLPSHGWETLVDRGARLL